MNATILLDEIDLPESGPAEIEVKRSFTIGISATRARRTVNSWLRNEVSMSFIAETPILVLDTRIVWRIPIAYTATHVGRAGLAGTVDVDITTTELYDTGSLRECLFATARKMAEQLPPFEPRTLPTVIKPVTGIMHTHILPTTNPETIIAALHTTTA